MEENINGFIVETIDESRVSAIYGLHYENSCIHIRMKMVVI